MFAWATLSSEQHVDKGQGIIAVCMLVHIAILHNTLRKKE